jgi:hypothetical protein
VLAQQFRQVMLIDGHPALAEQFYFGLVVVDADNLVADLRKTDSGNESDVT